MGVRNIGRHRSRRHLITAAAARRTRRRRRPHCVWRPTTRGVERKGVSKEGGRKDEIRAAHKPVIAHTPTAIIVVAERKTSSMSSHGKCIEVVMRL